jgi:hypothetical protein
MESITRSVKEMEAGERRSLEQVIGHELQDDQQVVIRIVTPEVAPDPEKCARAMADLRRLSEQAAQNCQSLGVTEQEIDEAIDEAMSFVRRRESR